MQELIQVPIGELTIDPANARKHSKRNLDSIAASLKRFGQQKPIVIDKAKVVRAGNGTLQAAISLGWGTIGCVMTELTGPDAMAYAIADNRTAELAEWDDPVLKATLESLEDFDKELLDACGYTSEELDELIESESDQNEITEDEVPEPPVDPITKPGDLWLLGEHRLLCGDSTKAEDVGRLMSGAKADMMFTDPPYGVSYVGKTKKALTIQNDGEADLPKLLDGSFAGALLATREGACWYVAAPPGPLHWEFARRLMELGVYRQTLVWVKDSMVLGHSDYHYKHEPIFYGWKPGASHREPPDRTQVSVWEIARPKRSEEHPTMKPVELVAKAICNSSLRDELVYEPFCGSGTTLIAAEQLGRKCYGMEISPQYCDVIVKRWESLTGQKATLQAADRPALPEATP